MRATVEQVRDLAGAVANQAQAIANGTLVGPLRGAVERLADNVDTLRAWVQEEV